MERQHTPVKLLLRKQNVSFDTLFAAFVIGISLFGVLMVADASAVQAETYFKDKLFFARQQIASLAVGIILFFISSFLPTKVWEKAATGLFWFSVILLVFVLIPGIGVEVLGARRWLAFESFTFQPTELVKLSLVLYLAKLFTKKSSWSSLAVFLFVAVLVGGFVVAEPDLGTSIVIGLIAVGMLFVSGAAPIWFFIAMIPLAFAVVYALIISSAYRKERLLTFLGQSDPLNSSYHISQVLLALAAGGFWGVGLGQSRAKYLFLPESATDSIFAVIAEEFGFIGATMLISVFMWIVFRTFSIARNANDNFAKLTASGIGFWIGVQTIINIAAMTATVPITGIPLPFISYGGTALVTMLIACGIVMGISRSNTIVKT